MLKIGENTLVRNIILCNTGYSLYCVAANRYAMPAHTSSTSSAPRHYHYPQHLLPRARASSTHHPTVRKFKHLVSQMSSVATKIIAALEPELFGHLAGISKKDLGADKDLPGSVTDLLCFALNATPESELCWTTFPACMNVNIFVEACSERYISMGTRLKATTMQQVVGYYWVDYERKAIMCRFWAEPVDIPMKQSLPESVDTTIVNISEPFSHDAKLNIHILTPKFDATIDLKPMFVDFGAAFPPTDTPWSLPKLSATLERPRRVPPPRPHRPPSRGPPERCIRLIPILERSRSQAFGGLRLR